MPVVDSDDVVIHIASEGDTSVGIWPNYATVILLQERELIAEDEEYKEAFRDGLKKFFRDIWDNGRVSVIFDEELRESLRAEEAFYKSLSRFTSRCEGKE